MVLRTREGPELDPSVIEAILHRLANGQSVRSIARDCAVSKAGRFAR